MEKVWKIYYTGFSREFFLQKVVDQLTLYNSFPIEVPMKKNQIQLESLRNLREAKENHNGEKRPPLAIN